MADNEEARLDKMIAETKVLIGQANAAAEGLRNVLKGLGAKGNETTKELLQNSACPADLQKQAKEEMEKLHQELAEEENRLQQLDGQQASGSVRPPKPGMTKI